MIETGLTIIWFFGLVYASNRCLRIGWCYAPFFSISFAGILLFFFSIFNYLKPAANGLFIAGIVLSAIGAFDYWKNRGKPDSFLQVKYVWVLSGLIVFSFLVTIHMKFTVDDDYVYWGIIGKYLNFYHHLPDSDTTIIRRHLSYTPGTSLIHYFIFQLAGQYKEALSYFAQNLFLISALFVVLAGKSFKKGVILFGLTIILMTLFSGSIFTKLQVDYLLSVYFFAVLWIIVKERPSIRTYVIISMPVCFLFLIKEVGFIMGIVLLLIAFFDLIFFNASKEEDKFGKEKFKALAVLCLSSILLFALKRLWTDHCIAMGFGQFNSAMNKDSILAALHIFSNETTQKGFVLFIKEFLFGPADRLNLPYLFWYLALFFVFYKLSSGREDAFKKRTIRIFIGLMITLTAYSILLYFFQIIVFNVGQTVDYTIGFSRYMNIIFAPILFFFVLLYADKTISRIKISPKIPALFVALSIMVVVASRVETSLHREKQYAKAEEIAKKIEATLDTGKISRIGVVPGTDKYYLWIRFLYHLLPNQVNHGRFPAGDQQIFLKNIKQYDYLLFYHPVRRILEWAYPLMDSPFEQLGFYRVEQLAQKADPDGKDNYGSKNAEQPVQLIKLFEL